MPFAITGAKYAPASVSTIGTTTVTVGTTPFVSGDFVSQRLVGLYSPNNQIVTNPGFTSDTAWTKGSGVTISGGVANATLAAFMLSQTVPIVVGRTYALSFNYTMSFGSRLRVSNSLVDGTNVVHLTDVLGSSGTITATFTATSPDGITIGADTMSFSGTLDNFTLTEVGNELFKGMAWVRRFVSTSQLELQTQFFDPATGQTVAQAVGDTVLVSKNFAESVVAGLAVSGRAVTITDVCTFGVDGNQAGLCFYDQDKFITATAAMLVSGGLTVFGKLDDYARNAVSGSIDIQSNQTNPLLCSNAAVHFFGYGGRWESSAAPAYFIGGNNQGTAGQTVVLNGIECPNDLLTNTAGGAWARNPTRHQLVNCYSITTSNNAIMRRWGDGVIRGGRYKFPNNASGPISVFGSDQGGTYTVAANPGDRAVILDMGASAFTGSGKPSLTRSSGAITINFNFINLVTTDFRSTSGNFGAANPNGTNTFRFSDTYTDLQTGTVGVILDNAGAEAATNAATGATWSPSLLRRTCVGATVTLNATSWTYGFKKYGYQPVSGAIAPVPYDLGTAGQADNVAFGGAIVQLVDSNVTLSQSAAGALTAIATLDDLYDAAIYWATAGVVNAKYPSLSAYPVSGNGTVLDLGAISLVIDATASSAFAINTGTNTITIKSTVLAAGTKFNALITTGAITLANGAGISATYTDSSGTRVTIRTLDNLPLSTELLINGVPQGWQTGQTGRVITVQPSSVVRIYAHAYGYQPKVVNLTGNTAGDYVISLVPETNVDISLDVTTRDAIAAGFAVGTDALSRLFLSVAFDMRPYSPAEVLNALHYFTVTQGSLIALAALQANSVDGFALKFGGFIVRSPAFYGKVSDAVTAYPTPAGIYVPLEVEVDLAAPAPGYYPVELNASGLVLSVALWTQNQATIDTATVAKEVWTYEDRTLNRALFK